MNTSFDQLNNSYDLIDEYQQPEEKSMSVEPVWISKCDHSHFVHLVEQHSDDQWFMLSQNIVGEGVKAKTFQVCRNTDQDCKYIVKVMNNTDDLDIDEWQKECEHEVKMHQKFEKLGLAPKLIDAMMCGHECYLIMQRMDITIRAYIKYLIKNNIFIQKDIEDIIDLLEDIASEMVQKAHDNNLVHGDLHMHNLMVDLDEDLLPFNIKLIDFGYSTEVGSPEIADADESLKELHLSFNILRNFFVNPGLMDTPIKGPRKNKMRRIQDNSLAFAPPRSLFGGDDDDQEEENEIAPRSLFGGDDDEEGFGISRKKLFGDDDEIF